MANMTDLKLTKRDLNKIANDHEFQLDKYKINEKTGNTEAYMYRHPVNAEGVYLVNFKYSPSLKKN